MRTWSSCGSSYQMVWPPASFVLVFLASGLFHGCSPFTLQYHTCRALVRQLKEGCIEASHVMCEHECVGSVSQGLVGCSMLQT